jgi:hypothetical protein
MEDGNLLEGNVQLSSGNNFRYKNTKIDAAMWELFRQGDEGELLVRFIRMVTTSVAPPVLVETSAHDYEREEIDDDNDDRAC